MASYSEILGAGYGAYAAIEQARHPTGNLPIWMLRTGVVITSLLVILLLFKRIPALSLMIYNVVRKIMKSETKKK